MVDDSVLNKHQRKKIKRKQRKQSERLAHRNLDAVTSEAVTEALRIAQLVVDAPSMADSDHVVDVELASLSEAQFVRKRINEALTVGEWLTDVQTWIWQADLHNRQPLSTRGAAIGFEIRIEQSPQT